MRTRDVALATLLLIAPPAAAEGPGLGEPLANSEIPFFAAYVRPDGHGLPAGKGDAAAGAEIWANACAMCHGPTGNEGPVQPVVGPSASYPKTAGRYWPYATTLFDYIRRAMPFPSPKALSDDEVYAVTAYILSRNGIIAETDVMDANSLPKVAMPNRKSFVDHWGRAGAKPY
jgi:cytochrome c